VTKYKLGYLIFNMKGIRWINGIRVADRHEVNSILSITILVNSTSNLSILIVSIVIPFLTYSFLTYYFLPWVGTPESLLGIPSPSSLYSK